MAVTVQPSDLRVFPDAEYVAAGATVTEDLSECGVVLAVKEIPAELLRPGTGYLFFSHTIKGQAHNMPLLARVIEVGATLIDYERIVAADGRRLIHFGRYAGLAGALDGLWALGRRLAADGIRSPFEQLQQTVAYPDLATALGAVDAVGEDISAGGLDPRVAPLVVGITGYGNVAGGAMEVLGRLPCREVTPAELDDAYVEGAARDVVHVAVFREADTVAAPGGGPVDVAAYRRDPSGYRSAFAPFLGRLSMLVNSIYWDPRGPRLVTTDELAALGEERRLRLIADLSCDIDGAIECTVKATTTDDPVFVHDPRTRQVRDGFEGEGMAVLAVDNLPCELPVDASVAFSAALEPFVPALAATSFDTALGSLHLPPEIARAVVAHRGALAPGYAYLADAVAASP